MCDIDTGERCDVWVETRRTAAKPHRCDACDAAIAIGEKYVRHFSAYDGYGESEKKCLACDAAMEEFAAQPGHLKVQPSYFAEALRECISDGIYTDEDGKAIVEPEDERWVAMLDAMAARGAAARVGA